MVSGEREGEVEGDGEEEEPARLAQQAPEAGIEGRLVRAYSDGGNSRLMMVIAFDSIEMVILAGRPLSRVALAANADGATDGPTESVLH